MNEANLNDEELFAAKLAAYDAALADGPRSAEDTADDEELRRAMTCLEKLESIWPRRKRSLQVTQIPGDTLTDTLPQTRLGRFQLIRELGRGGGGVVYLAHDPTLHRQVAL